MPDRSPQAKNRFVPPVVSLFRFPQLLTIRFPMTRSSIYLILPSGHNSHHLLRLRGHPTSHSPTTTSATCSMLLNNPNRQPLFRPGGQPPAQSRMMTFVICSMGQIQRNTSVASSNLPRDHRSFKDGVHGAARLFLRRARFAHSAGHIFGKAAFNLR